MNALVTVDSPCDCVVQWFTSFSVPHNCRLTLIGDSNGFDVGDLVTLI